MKWFLIVILFFLPSTSFAAISFDVATGGLSGGSGNVTVGTLTNGVAIFHTSSEDVTDAVTAVTLNGVAGVALQFQTCAGCNTNKMWSVVLGSVSGSIAWTTTGGTNTTAVIATYSGVHQTTPIQSSQKTSVIAANSISLTATPTTSGTWAAVTTKKNGGCAVDSLTNITNRYNTASANAMQEGDSNAELTISVGYTQTVTSSGCAQNHSLIQAVLEPSVAVSTPQIIPANFIMFN